jgi:endonuclease/exonuclease/phosphatase (EEP) superfamily protein YafD
MPRLRSKSSWVRIWDFPRLQVALLGTGALLSLAWTPRSRDAARLPPLVRRALAASLVLAVGYQWSRIWRYTPLAPREVEDARQLRRERMLSLVVANVMQYNRADALVTGTIAQAAADVIMFAETDGWWRERLAPFARAYPHRVEVPLDNTYGMILYSRLPLAHASVEFLQEPGIPSIHTDVQLRDGIWVELHCMHPRSPAPDKSEDSLERDAELLRLAYRVRDARRPVIVCGDLNDVAWSRTTRRFQKVSRLLDPRRGRGFFNTYNAYTPGLRFPLDHFFHSEHFRLVELKVLPHIGSDHFAVFLALSCEPSATDTQQPPEADAEDRRRARDTLAAASS